MSYIFVFEDLEIRRGESYLKEDLEACDDGLLDIIDISDPTAPLAYFKGGWEELQENKEKPHD